MFMCCLIYIYIYIYMREGVYLLSKVGDRSRERPLGSFFNSFYTKVEGRAQLLSIDCSTLPLTRPLYCWVLSKEVSSTIFKVFGMTRLKNSKPKYEHVAFQKWYPPDIYLYSFIFSLSLKTDIIRYHLLSVYTVPLVKLKKKKKKKIQKCNISQ